MLEAPPEDTIAGLRDRATLSVGLGRAEIAALTSILPRTAVIGCDRRARSVLFEQALGLLFLPWSAFSAPGRRPFITIADDEAAVRSNTAAPLLTGLPDSDRQAGFDLTPSRPIRSQMAQAHPSSPSSAFASFRSGVSKPSVNQP
jgi:hypothetical protein